MARDDRQPVVHLLAQRTDGLRLGRKLFLPPDRRHRPRDRDEIGRSGEQHPLLEGKVPKRGVMLKRGRKKMLAGHERSEEHTSELQSLMRISYAVFCLKKKTPRRRNTKSNNSESRR